MLGVVVHAIDVATHPTQGPGWRWAVHVGRNWRDTSTCLQAGWAPNENEAKFFAEMHAVTAAKVAMLLTGERWFSEAVAIDYDPTPPEALDTRSIFAVI